MYNISYCEHVFIANIKFKIVAVKKHTSNKKITKELSTELITSIGKKMAEEYAKQRKILQREKLSLSLDHLLFSFSTESEKIDEHTIEKFLEHFNLKKGRGEFLLRVQDNELTVYFDYNDKEAEFSVSSESEDQIWAEGITTVFHQLIEDFKSGMVKSEITEMMPTISNLENKLEYRWKKDKRLWIIGIGITICLFILSIIIPKLLS